MANRIAKILERHRVIDSVTVEKNEESPELHFSMEIKGFFNAEELFNEICGAVYEKLNTKKPS